MKRWRFGFGPSSACGPSRRRVRARCGPLAALLILAAGCAPPPPESGSAVEQVARSEGGMVVAAHPLATAAGVEMLERGGNAADAAVAAAFAVSVVEPSMNSIGGRTQILLRTPAGGFRGIDATTQAPDTYDPDTAPQAGYGTPTVGVPGTVAGLTRLLAEHGTLPLSEVMAPAIRYAAEGFALLPGEAARQASAVDQLKESEGATTYFIRADGSPYQAGEHFVQPDLAEVLRRIAQEGADVFYRGEIAETIAADIEGAGGHVTMAALAAYRAEDARVVRGSYRGHELVGTFTPAAGAMTIGILHIIENFDMATADEVTWSAVVGQALALGFEAARTHRGPDAWEILTSREWAREQAARIQLPVAAVAAAPVRGGGFVPTWKSGAGSEALVQSAEPVHPDRYLSGGGTAGGVDAPVRLPSLRSGAEGSVSYLPAPDDQGHTTHLSTADADGMTVALTQTIGPAMGSKVATPGLGFLYAATLGGYLGRLEPGERARSNISPFMVMAGGEPMLVLGAAGGARIVSAVVQAVCRVIDQGLELPAALAAPRIHPMQGSLIAAGAQAGFQMETSPVIGWGEEVITALRGMDIAVQEVPAAGAFGRIHGISYDVGTDTWTGAADPDWEGSAAAPGG